MAGPNSKEVLAEIKKGKIWQANLPISFTFQYFLSSLIL